jgi:protein-S-isoprenylcysteine O-methyltransferase Ste14
MRATKLEFKLRMAINAAIIILGLWAPWIDAGDIGKRIALVEWLPLELSRLGLLSFTVAAPVVIAFAAALAAVGALLRVWGTAYLGPATVQNFQMKAGAVMADGPFRYVRNPLYLGVWFMVAALAFLMPPTGALFAITLLTVFLLRLILGEEAFLSAQLGESYQAYLRTVPRLIPRLRTHLQSIGAEPHWFRALLAEITPLGVFFTLAFLSWSYDQRMMLRAILISFGISLIARAFVSGVLAPSKPAE